MNKVKEFFNEIKWFEYLFMSVSLLAIVIFSIIYKFNFLYIISSVLGIIGVFFLSKGNIVGVFVCIIQLFFYSIISYFNGFYGEVLTNVFIALPLYIINIVTWIKNINSKSGEVKINSKIKTREVLLSILIISLISIVIYFLLDYFNTSFVLLSTLTFLFNTLGVYFLVRRSGINFIFYLLSNVSSILMWIFMLTQTNNLSIITTLINIAIYFVLNTYGIINWFKLEKKQNTQAK